jgi:hypothetical protein
MKQVKVRKAHVKSLLRTLLNLHIEYKLIKGDRFYQYFLVKEEIIGELGLEMA